MQRTVKLSYLIAAVASITALLVVSPALGGPSLKSLVKKEVKKQLAGKTGPAGPPGTPGTPGAPGAPGAPGQAFTLTLDDNETGNIVADGFRLHFVADADGNCDVPSIVAAADDSWLWMTDEFGGNDDFDFNGSEDINVWDNGNQVTVDARTIDGSGVAQFEFATTNFEGPFPDFNIQCLVTGTALSN